LVEDERLEGRNDDCNAFGEHSGQLITQGFAASGGHQDKAVVAHQGSVDRLSLVSPEVIKTELSSEHLQQENSDTLFKVTLL